MKIEIEIPKHYEVEFNRDRFEETFGRLCADAHAVAGNYEKETMEMLIKAFKDGKVKE